MVSKSLWRTVSRALELRHGSENDMRKISNTNVLHIFISKEYSSKINAKVDEEYVQMDQNTVVQVVHTEIRSRF